MGNLAFGPEQEDENAAACAAVVSKYEELRRRSPPLSDLELYRELQRALQHYLAAWGPGAVAEKRTAPESPRPTSAKAYDGKEDKPPPEELGSSGSMSGTGMSVLVVDDSHISCKLASRTLLMMGHRVDVVLSGEAALTMLRERPAAWDLVLLDIVMPGLDGIEVLSRLKGSPATSRVPVAMLSGLEDHALADVCRQQGAVEVLLKPLKANAVSRVVTRYCRAKPDPAAPRAVGSSRGGGGSSRSQAGQPLGNGGSSGTSRAGGRAQDSWSLALASERRRVKEGDSAPSFSLVDGSRTFGPNSVENSMRLVLAFFPAAVARDVARCGDRLLSSLNRHYAALRSAGADVVAVGAEPPHALVALQQDLGLRFRVLSDPSLEVAGAYVGLADMSAWLPAGISVESAAAASRSNHAGVVILSPREKQKNSEVRVVDYIWRAVDASGEFDANGAIDMHDLLLRLGGNSSSTPLQLQQQQQPSQQGLPVSAGGSRKGSASSSGGGGGGSSRANDAAAAAAAAAAGPRGLAGGAEGRGGTPSSGGKGPASIRNAGRVSILVVDDSNISSKLALRKLAALGHDTMHAENGQIALELLRRFPADFDLVLLDIVMPVMDGVELLTIMKADKRLRHVPTVMLSGLEDDMLASVCLESGATAVLQKPLDTSEVEDLIRSAGIGRR